MKLTAVCNAGILLEQDGTAVLIDGIGCDHAGFTGLDAVTYQEILQKQGRFSALSTLLFTHSHPDHCDLVRVQAIRKAHPLWNVWIPDDQTPTTGKIQVGPNTITYVETAHMLHRGEQVRHFVFLIQTGSCTIYMMADTVPDTEIHRRILGDIRPDYIFVNPLHLAAPDMQVFLQNMAPKRIFAYHIPTDPADQTGLRRKVIRTVARIEPKTVPITLITTYPTYLGEV